MSSSKIHPTAIVDPSAVLAADVEIGPYSVIGAGVSIGARTKIWHHATVWGDTVIGEDCEVFPYCSIGMQTQDLKFAGGKPGVRIGNHNTLREYVSINAGTNDGEMTVLGDHNNLLAYCHVGHGCTLGNHIIASNGVAFAGHVVVEDHAGIGGGGTAIQQFCHIGERSFIGGCSKIVQDIPPYMLGDGNPAKIRMFNKVGLERSGFDAAQMSAIKFIFKAFYRQGFNRQQAIEHVAASEYAETAEASRFLSFVANSQRGLTGGTK